MKSRFSNLVAASFALAVLIVLPGIAHSQSGETPDYDNVNPKDLQLVVTPDEVDEEGYYAPCKKETSPELYARCIEKRQQLLQSIGAEKRAKYVTTTELEERKKKAIEKMVAEEQISEETLDEIARRLQAERNAGPSLKDIREMEKIEAEENVKSMDDLRSLVLGKGGTKKKKEATLDDILSE